MFYRVFSGVHCESAVLGMHGRCLDGRQDIEVELTEVYLTTGRRGCHCGTDIFRRQDVTDFRSGLLKRRMETHGYEHLLPNGIDDEEEGIEI